MGWVVCVRRSFVHSLESPSVRCPVWTRCFCGSQAREPAQKPWPFGGAVPSRRLREPLSLAIRRRWVSWFLCSVWCFCCVGFVRQSGGGRWRLQDSGCVDCAACRPQPRTHFLFGEKTPRDRRLLLFAFLSRCSSEATFATPCLLRRGLGWFFGRWWEWHPLLGETCWNQELPRISCPATRCAWTWQLSPSVSHLTQPGRATLLCSAQDAGAGFAAQGKRPSLTRVRVGGFGLGVVFLCVARMSQHMPSVCPENSRLPPSVPELVRRSVAWPQRARPEC